MPDVAVLAKANAVVHMKIVEYLNSLAGKGLLLEKLDFLSDCVKVYGADIIRDSSIPWVSVLTLPGHVELLDASRFLSRLSGGRSLFLAFETQALGQQ